MVQRLEDEKNVMTFIVHEKLPLEYSSTEQTVENLRKVAREPAMGHQEIKEIKKKVKCFDLSHLKYQFLVFTFTIIL